MPFLGCVCFILFCFSCSCLVQPRHSFMSRFVSCLIAARMYAKDDATYHTLHEVLATDCDKLFFDGITTETPSVPSSKLWSHMFPLKIFKGFFQEHIFVFVLWIFWIHLCCQLCCEGPICFHLAFVALKGDWPYLRKAAGLSSGFASIRKCHWCTFPASCFIKWCFHDVTFGPKISIIWIPRNHGFESQRYSIRWLLWSYLVLRLHGIRWF